MAGGVLRRGSDAKLGAPRLPWNRDNPSFTIALDAINARRRTQNRPQRGAAADNSQRWRDLTRRRGGGCDPAEHALNIGAAHVFIAEPYVCAETLRRYLSRLPDFDDDEALLDARTHVRTHPDLLQGLIFFLNWPDAGLATDVILSRHAELDGNAYEVLTPISELLRSEHPLAATLVWRSMITFALQNNRAKRYRHAARHLASCAQADMAIADYGVFQSHDAFVQDLRRTDPRKHAFWDKVDHQGRV